VARYFDVHPDNPQSRAIGQVVDIVRSDGLIAYPTDSCFALGCQIGNADGLARIREIRQLDAHHHFTLVCLDFSQLSQFVHVSNAVFRAVKACTPGPYTFILPATKEVPRRLLHPKKLTVGVRIPSDAVVRALLTELGEPLVSSTLLLPGDDEPMTQGWEIRTGSTTSSTRWWTRASAASSRRRWSTCPVRSRRSCGWAAGIRRASSSRAVGRRRQAMAAITSSRDRSSATWSAPCRDTVSPSAASSMRTGAGEMA
jgi:tRNA threonylcarbamoyl adenosine modification protein (Sua5/YciO/YrdC/YwlC family)